MLLPILLLLALVSFVSVRLQVGPLWTTKVFSPKLSKFNPLSGIKKMLLSTQTVVRLLRSLLMASVVAVAPILVLRSQWDNLLPLFHQDVQGIVSFMLLSGSTMVLYALVPMLLIGLGRFGVHALGLPAEPENDQGRDQGRAQAVRGRSQDQERPAQEDVLGHAAAHAGEGSPRPMSS
jgi:hypothetical protein